MNAPHFFAHVLLLCGRTCHIEFALEIPSIAITIPSCYTVSSVGSALSSFKDGSFPRQSRLSTMLGQMFFACRKVACLLYCSRS